MGRLLAVCAAIALTVSSQAQGPSADWQTLTTPHFRIHYPKEYSAWTERAASRLESIRAAVTREVGFDPPTVIDVIVNNPIAQPNGSAWPLLDTPRIIFFTEPPGPRDTIGAYTSWIDLLAVHEVAHVIHMLRPSRNPIQRIIESIVPLNRLTLGAPRWVLEGYATVIEGRLTGAGRPSSTLRALILRQWAAHGRLPTYDELDTERRYLGGSMAYLAGSAFLEWLEARTGPESLRNVWLRMTANERRSFDEAFTGVFGESPERLYGEFTAELTASAIAVNRAAPKAEGDLWQETSRGAGDPAVSPDGKKLVIVQRPRQQPAKLVVWSTAAPVEEEKRLAEKLAKIRERDPLDILPVRSKPLTREPINTYSPLDGGDLTGPRWTRDGRSILFEHRQPDADGFWHHDLFLWVPEEGRTHRITRLADVSQADPMPDGRSAVAVRTRHGYSQLVTVDLAGGEVRPLTEPSLDLVYSHPRVDQSGSRLAYVVNRNGTWILVVRVLGTGAESVIEPGAGEVFASPEWTSNGELIATILSGGFADLYRISKDGHRIPLTRISGGAMQPAPSPDGRVFFMSLEPDGFVVRVIDRSEPAARPPFDESLVPAIPPSAPAVAAFEISPLPPSRPYGIGFQEVSLILGQNLAPSQNATEAGIRIGDVLGRLNAIAVASFGSDDAQRGVGVASAWRGWPIDLTAHLFRSEDRRAERSGAELRALWDRIAPRTTLAMTAGALAGDTRLTFVESDFSFFRRAPRWRFDGDVSLGYHTGDFEQSNGRIGAALTFGSGMNVRLRFDRVRNEEGRIELGGLPSTIIPRSAFIHRILDPSIPVGSMIGDEYEGRRVETTLAGFTFFYQQHRVDGVDVEVTGTEIVIAFDPMPILRLPGLDATLGVARVLSGPLGEPTNWWLGLRWRP
jgi:hypothetical protein